MSPTRSNISKEEEALKLAIEQVNEDTRNYPGIKLRSLIRYADPDIDFDNIEQGKEKLCSNRRQLEALDSRTRTKTKHSVFAATKSSNFFVFNEAGTTKLTATTLSRHHCHGFEHAHNEQKLDLVLVLVVVFKSKAR